MTADGSLTVNLVRVKERRVVLVDICWCDGLICSIVERGPACDGIGYLIPGFVDAHVHVESSLLPPAEFARLAARHGTVACVCDPHEIANVLGEDGVRFMLHNAAASPLHFRFGASPCVPATPFETAGAHLDASALEQLFAENAVGFLAEVMNYPGVLAGDRNILEKIAIARRLGKPVDGHAPGLRGSDAARYAAVGISTDHECTDLAEAHDKLASGMHILIREGSAAHNFAALQPLIASHPERVMLCSDDKHPDDLMRGHINVLAARALSLGHDVFDVLRCACLNPVEHYQLPVGRLCVGDAMDAVEVADLASLTIKRVWLHGTLVSDNGQCRLPPVAVEPINRFHPNLLTPTDLSVPVPPAAQARIIEACDGSLLTTEVLEEAPQRDGYLAAEPTRNLLLLTVVDRYGGRRPPAIALIRGFGLRQGALASSVAHDSHNVIAVGADIECLCAAVNAVMRSGGGLAVADGSEIDILPLPIAGLMSDQPGDRVAARYVELDRHAHALGSSLRAPFMTLSFMALLVIPELKLSDQGLFDGRSFAFTDLLRT